MMSKMSAVLIMVLFKVPGILEWPAMIKSNSMTWHPAYVSDYLPTILEVVNITDGSVLRDCKCGSAFFRFSMYPMEIRDGRRME